MRHVLKLGRISLAALLASGVALAQKPADPKPTATGAQAVKPAAPGAQAAKPAAGGKSVAAPKIEIAQETKEVGTVPKGQVIETDFIIKNVGGSDLVITDGDPLEAKTAQAHFGLLAQVLGSARARRDGRGTFAGPSGPSHLGTLV